MSAGCDVFDQFQVKFQLRAYDMSDPRVIKVRSHVTPGTVNVPAD